MHKRMRWRRVTVLSAHSYASSCFRWFLLSSNGPFDLVATFLCPPRKRPKGAREDRATHVKSNFRVGLSCSVGYICGGFSNVMNLGWPWTGNWRVQMLWMWSQSIISGEFWESHVKQTWSCPCPLWGSDREDKRRQLLCIIPKFSHGTAAKIRAQHAAITPMHGLSHIPCSNIFHANMRTIPDNMGAILT